MQLYGVLYREDATRSKYVSVEQFIIMYRAITCEDAWPLSSKCWPGEMQCSALVGLERLHELHAYVSRHEKQGIVLMSSGSRPEMCWQDIFVSALRVWEEVATGISTWAKAVQG